MHSILFRESFFFCSRDDLERLQPLSQSLLNIIVAGSNTLPLRPIQRVNMNIDDADDMIEIFVEVDFVSDDREPDYEASILDGDFAETFRRLQNTCIRDFRLWIRDSPFLRYWEAQEAAVFTVVSIYFYFDEAKDYDLLDSIVNHLRPKTTSGVIVNEPWLENGHNSTKLELLARDSLLNSLRTCCLIVWDDGFPPPSFILNEPGYPNYELCCLSSQIADGIDGFIESFVRDGCANKKLESVYIKWYDDDEGPQSPAPKQLSNPTKADEPLPESEMAMLSIHEVHRVVQCEVHSFINKKQWQRMDVYKWNVEYGRWDVRGTAHILQCRMKNL